MGHGAFISIANTTSTPITVSYPSLNGMNNNPPSGTIPAGGCLSPYCYIEASATATTNFTMSLGGTGLGAIPFAESGSAFSVNNSIAFQSSSDTYGVVVSIAVDGSQTQNQDVINVIIYAV